jgi:succinate dehydrogenase / fumarate reductase cytochrome b subunit
MKWFINFLTSSIGQKVIMSLTGLFLISFLAVHLTGNLQLLAADEGEAFNTYAYFMTTNPVVKTLSWGLYAGFLLHAIQGLALWAKNRKARGTTRYAVNALSAASHHAPKRASSHMALLGTILLVFLGIHMGDFWYNMKFTETIAQVTYPGHDIPVKDLYMRVSASFSQWWLVLIYVISMVVLAFHLLHGFWSAFQTLGLNHRKYTPLIKAVGTIYSIVVPLAFAAIPVYMYFKLNA